MRLCGRVPPYARWRPFFGAMVVPYKTTATLAALVDSDLGGWGSDSVLFAAHTKADAAAGGYDREAQTYRLLLWRGCGAPEIVLRYLHYFEESAGLAGGEAAAERRGPNALDGMRTKACLCTVPGVCAVEYF